MNAVANGAVVVVAKTGTKIQDIKVPIMYVDDVRQSMSLCAKRFFGDVCDKMDIIGVTGTNGKTTCTYILRHLLGTKNIGVIGTLGSFIGEEPIESKLTTPDPIQLHEIFATMYRRGVRTVVMEVTAHAIHYKKIAGIKFCVGMFTNLTQDHLDFFETMERYGATKIDWVAGNSVNLAITNRDDEYGRLVIGKHPLVRQYGIDDVTELELFPSHSTFRLGKRKLTLNMGGRFNVYNALCCISAVKEMGLPITKIAKRLKSIQPVPGRFNIIKAKRGYSVIIDYAHTPDSIEKILQSARELCKPGARLICVFGCGGDRDSTKRPQMGQMSGTIADYTIVTSDNPRTESPISIMIQIEAGLKTVSENYELIEDRQTATKRAIEMAKRGDVIVIAGKGAEVTQEINGVFHKYSDTETVKQYIL